MINKNKYEPEDIEKLLRNKSFDSLLEEERDFILNHIESEIEYQNMRSLLLNVENSNWEDLPEMDTSLRSDLIRKHKDHHRKSMRIWLNTFFGIGKDKYTWYQAPGFQLVFATVLLLGAIFTFQYNDEPNNTLAETKIEKEKGIPLEIIKERSQDKKNQPEELKKLEEPVQEIELDDAIGNSSQIENTLKNSDIIDNASSSVREEIALDIDQLVVENDKFDLEKDHSKVNEIGESEQYGDLSVSNEIRTDDADEMQLDMNTDLKDEAIIAEEQNGIVADFEGESSVSNNGSLEQTKESLESMESPQATLMDVVVTSESRSRGSVKRKAEPNKNISRAGIVLSKNPELINQLFTSY